MVSRQEKVVTPAPGNELAVARWLLEHPFSFSDGKTPILTYAGGQWLLWDRTTAWRPIKEDQLEDMIMRILDNAAYRTAPKEGDEEGVAPLKNWAPTSRKVSSIVKALRAVARTDMTEGDDSPFVTRSMVAGDWIDGSHTGESWVHLQDVLLNLRTRKIQPHTPKLFTYTALPFHWGDVTEGCPLWLQMLEQNFAGEQDQISLLQEWCGYVISGRTDLQKAMWVWGPMRSGKGTIIRILSALMGEENTAGMSSDALSAGGSALAPALGKTLVTFSDVRLQNSPKSVERILTWTDEDAMSVSIKYSDDFTGQMPGRLMFASNVTPRFPDSSPAIMHRLLILTTRVSNLGKEQSDLTSRILRSELPGIFAWALDGLDRLEKNGKFTEPESSLEVREDALEASSALLQFVQECCVLDPDAKVSLREFFDSYKDWCKETETFAGSQGALREKIDPSSLPITARRIGERGTSRPWHVIGCRLMTSAELMAHVAPIPADPPASSTDDSGDAPLDDYDMAILRACETVRTDAGEICAAMELDETQHTRTMMKDVGRLARRGLLTQSSTRIELSDLGLKTIHTATQLDLEGAV